MKYIYLGLIHENTRKCTYTHKSNLLKSKHITLLFLHRILPFLFNVNMLLWSNSYQLVKSYLLFFNYYLLRLLLKLSSRIHASTSPERSTLTLACLIILSNVILVMPFGFCIQWLLALFGSDKTFLWIYVLCCALHSPVYECEWCFVFRFLTLSIHLWHWEPHQPVQHQWYTSAPCSTHLHPAERASVCRGRNQHQWGEGRDLLLQTPTDVFYCVIIQQTDFELYENTPRYCKWFSVTL